MTKIDSFTTTIPLTVKRTVLETAVIHFAGDSGDGMQVVGAQFTHTSARLGNDVRTHPDFPAEIRAPAGTLPGVSGFQLSFSAQRIHTPGDDYDVLIAMNPAAMQVSIRHLKRGGLLILDEDKFTPKDLKKANLAENLLETVVWSEGRVIRLPMTTLTLQASAGMAISRSQARKAKNLFALGVVYWLYHRPLEDTIEWIAERFKEDPVVVEANKAALKAGYHYAITAGLFAEHYAVESAPLPAGEYRQITGNQALAWGALAAAVRADRKLLVSGYPITPASDILHILARCSAYGVTVFQAEDEIAAIGATIGAAYGGALALTSTSGPGMDLKSEGLGLAVMAELPLVVVDVQRAGPSTGMPTKVEQSDLLTALFGRHGECPVPVLAAATPGDCFEVVLEAFRIAITYMTPVIVLSDAALANGTEPWQIPTVSALPDLRRSEGTVPSDFKPYRRDPVTLARPWVTPGTVGKEHRIGGLEKEVDTGNISYDPDNHQQMVEARAAKVRGIAYQIVALESLGEMTGEILIVGWGSTYGAIRTAVERLRKEGCAISFVHCRALNPLPETLAAWLKGFEHVLVVELNLGQLYQWIRAHYLVNAVSLHKVTGKPFTVSELLAAIAPYRRPLACRA